MFNALIDAGCSRGEAIDKLVVKLGVDRGTVNRALGRAGKGDRGRTRAVTR